MKRNVNVKIKNIINRRFRVRVFDVYFTNFLNKVVCKFKKIQQNLASAQYLVLQQKHVQHLKRSI